MLCKNEESLHTGQIALQCCVKMRRTMTTTWLMFWYITSTIQHYSLTLSVAPLFSLSPYPIFPTCTMADSSDDEVYVPWWDRTSTGSSSNDDGDSSNETETESDAYSSDEELFYDYEHAYEEAM